MKDLVSITDSTGNINTATPYLDMEFIDFEYPDSSTDDRDIDAQYVSNNVYVSTVFDEQSCFCGFNFADKRIKCYPLDGPQYWYVRCVRGQTEYGENDFSDNVDGTVTDMATGLMWQQSDDGAARNWEDALVCRRDLELAGYDDWRLPNIKQLKSIADYSRDDPAIDPIFETADPDGWF